MTRRWTEGVREGGREGVSERGTEGVRGREGVRGSGLIEGQRRSKNTDVLPSDCAISKKMARVLVLNICKSS